MVTTLENASKIETSKRKYDSFYSFTFLHLEAPIHFDVEMPDGTTLKVTAVPPESVATRPVLREIEAVCRRKGTSDLSGAVIREAILKPLASQEASAVSLWYDDCGRMIGRACLVLNRDLFVGGDDVPEFEKREGAERYSVQVVDKRGGGSRKLYVAGVGPETELMDGAADSASVREVRFHFTEDPAEALTAGWEFARNTMVLLYLEGFESYAVPAEL